MIVADAHVARARSVVGCRFRPHGRNAEEGFDCVGLVAWALDAGAMAPRGYALRSNDRTRAEAGLRGAGLVPVAGTGVAGDVLLLATASGQLHLAIRVRDGVVHADAVARRVVERPGPVPWPLIGAWRRT